jgi:diphthamide biosynthesis protein 3
VIALYLQSPTPLVSGNPTPGTAAAAASDDGSVEKETLSLLDPDIEAFRSNMMGPVARHLSLHLASTVDRLRKIADAAAAVTTTTAATAAGAATRPRNPARPAASKASQVSLSSQLAGRLRQLRAVQMHELPSARRQMAVTAAAVLAARAELLERMVILLERTKHGSLARASKARAEHLATVAEGIERKMRCDF